MEEVTAREYKKSRERESNWSTAEKEFLRECINLHLDVIEHKGNDTSMILKKKNAWKAIRAAMASAGYDREIIKLKSQWGRMKVSARKAVAIMKKATLATGNCTYIPEISAEDNLVQCMISHEFEEDEILIDSNCIEMPEYLERDLDKNFDKEIIELDDSPSFSQQSYVDTVEGRKRGISPITTPLKSEYGAEKKNNTTFSKRLRNLPKVPSKTSIILERKNQIATETQHSEEINKLQKQHYEAEIEYKKLLYALELKRLQKQIEFDEEFHNLKMQILKNKSNNQILF